jgi:anti-anti-sigma regulatory factor
MSNEKNQIFILPEVLDISNSQNLLNDVSRIFGKGIESITLDGEKVRRLTTPCLQIIYSVSVECRSQGVKFSIKKPSDVMVSVFGDLGFSEQLKNWSEV